MDRVSSLRRTRHTSSALWEIQGNEHHSSCGVPPRHQSPEDQ